MCIGTRAYHDTIHVVCPAQVEMDINNDMPGVDRPPTDKEYMLQDFVGLPILIEHDTWENRKDIDIELEDFVKNIRKAVNQAAYTYVPSGIDLQEIEFPDISQNLVLLDTTFEGIRQSMHKFFPDKAKASTDT